MQGVPEGPQQGVVGEAPSRWGRRAEAGERLATCAVEGCERPRKRSGDGLRSLCAAHDRRKTVHGDVMADVPVRETTRSVLRRDEVTP